MSAPDSSLGEAKAVLQGMAAEAEELKQALGSSITDAVAGWLAQQYALAARERLAGAEGAGRLEILRAFAQDWALLRRGDRAAAVRAYEEALRLKPDLAEAREALRTIRPGEAGVEPAREEPSRGF